MRQVKRAPGFQCGSVGQDPSGGFWTVTLWHDEAGMRAYRNTGFHMKAMPKLIDWCDEAAVAHWRQDTMGLPSANEALERMQSTGHLSKVCHPSAAHAARETAPTPEGPRILNRF